LSSKGALSKENKKIVMLLQECRQRNLFIFIVLPTFFLLETYAAIFRTQALIHAAFYKTNFKLRYYRVYNYQNKKILYLTGKKFYDYSRPRVSASFRFYGKFPPTINRDAYLRKKHKAFATLDTKNEEDTYVMKQRDRSNRELHDKFGMSFRKISDMYKKDGCPLAHNSISTRYNRNVP
jgi:hypothetical protein